MTDKKDNKQQLPDVIQKLAEQLHEKMGINVNTIAIEGGMAGRLMRLPSVITTMYLLAKLIDEEYDKKENIDIGLILILTQMIIEEARSGMPDGFFEHPVREADNQKLKGNMLKDAMDTLREVQNDCNCEVCQERKANAATDEVKSIVMPEHKTVH